MLHRSNLIFLGIILTWSLRAICDSSVSIANVQPYLDQRYCVRDCLWSGELSNLQGFLDCSDPILNGCYCRDDLASSASSYITSCVNGGCASNTPDVVRAISVYNGYCSSAAPATNTVTPTADDSGATTTLRVTATPTVNDSGATTTVLVTATPTIDDSRATTTVQVETTVSNSPSTDSGTRSQVSTITSTFSRPRSSATLTIYSTETFSTGSNNSLGKGLSHGGLSQADKIALGIGLGVGLGMGIPPILFAIYDCQKKNRRVNERDQEMHRLD